IVSTVMAVGAGHAIAPGFGEVAVPALGLVSKLVGDRMTKVAAARLQDLVKARSPLGRQASINAAAQSALTTQPVPRRLPAILRSALPAPYSSAPLIPGLQGPVP